LNETVSRAVSLFEQGDLVQAESVCIEYVAFCQNEFMEQLTVNTATDLIGGIVLLGQIHASMKKPWKIFPYLENAGGCIRFLCDFMQDREMVSQTCKVCAELYANGGYYPEAADLYERSASVTEDQQMLEELWYFSYLNRLRLYGEVASEKRNNAKAMLSSECESAIFEDAKRDFSAMIQTDPAEGEEEYLKIRFDIERDVDEALSSVDQSALPFCLLYWRTKKEILQKKYNIEWKSPEECNPQIRFC
jgi:hypothetical protein